MFFKPFFYTFLLFFMLNSSFAAVVIHSRIDNEPWKKVRAITPTKGQQITLKTTKISNATIRWYQIFPDISKIYKNANHPWEANPYKWVGFGKIDYERKELTHFRGKWKIRPFEKHSDTEKQLLREEISHSRFYQKNFGSFWFQVEIEKNGQITKSAGIENSNERGLSPKVFRVSIRNGKGYIGYLTTFFNVPGLFGSINYQSNHYIGVDCADVLVAAYAKWRNQSIKKNYNVAMLVNKLSKRNQFDLVNGVPSKNLKWGKEVDTSDFIAVRYVGARQYQHIGALSGDSNKNGILDGRDLIIHAGPSPLHYSYLLEGHFNGHVVILKPSNRLP
ncbi:MAG: hypothetical protein KAI83_17855 [Thiomargarita sp.]|nr:hypothetical protein [Thiomargarita sp.]